MSPLAIYLSVGFLLLFVQRFLTHVVQKVDPAEEFEKLREVTATAPSEFVPIMLVVAVTVYVTGYTVAWPYFCVRDLYHAIKNHIDAARDAAPVKDWKAFRAMTAKMRAVRRSHRARVRSGTYCSNRVPEQKVSRRRHRPD